MRPLTDATIGADYEFPESRIVGGDLTAITEITLTLWTEDEDSAIEWSAVFTLSENPENITLDTDTGALDLIVFAGDWGDLEVERGVPKQVRAEISMMLGEIGPRVLSRDLTFDIVAGAPTP